MDRRDFLKTGGAVAVAGSAATSANAEAPAQLSGAVELLMSAPDGLVLEPQRLGRRIETATGGRYYVAVTSAAADAGEAADLTLAGAHHRAHPAFAMFAGLPGAQGLDAPALQAWLGVGGGQMLWDDLGAQFGFKPLVAGHTGPSAGLWAGARLETAAEFSGSRIQVAGIAADVVRALGAVPVDNIDPSDLRAAFADGRVHAAELLGPLAVVTSGIEPLAQRLYAPGINGNGMLLSLQVRKPLWDRMSTADQAIFEACAAEEYRLSLAEAQAHALIAAQVAGPAKWPVRLAFSGEVASALAAAARDVVEQIAATDPAARRIHDSYQAFRGLMGQARIA